MQRRNGEGLTAVAALSLAVLAGLSSTAGPAQAAFPGANGRIACSGALAEPSSDGSRLEIFDVNPNGSGERRLQENTDSDYNPRYSADGKRIAFVKEPHVWTMSSDGNDLRGPLTSEGSNTFVGGWSPDGREIVFQSNRDGNFEVYKMSADGSNQTNLTNNAASNANSDSQPAWSPDGTKIAFQSNRDGNANIHTMNPDGSDVTNLTRDSLAEESAPSWSPDGRQIAFQSDREPFLRPGITHRNLEIFRMKADGSGVTRLTFSDFSGVGVGLDLTGFDLNPAWSPEGDRIVFHSGRAPEYRDSNGATIIGQWEAYTIDAVNGEGPGGDLKRLTTRPGNDERCDWQPTSRATGRGPGLGPDLDPSTQAPFAGCPSLAANVIRGSAAANSITGTARADRIFSAGGNDTVDGLAGNDCIDLGPGADRGQGGLGSDLVLGGVGNDVLKGVRGNDRISGGRGRDRINGGSGRDAISAGSSGDRVAGDRGVDRINGNSGNDLLKGNSGDDRLKGSSGRDVISGGSGNDRIDARDGRRDRILCGRGRDTVLTDAADRISRACERITRV